MVTPFVKRTETYVQGARTLAGHYFTSRDIFTEEMERVFCRRWLCIGRQDEISHPGDFIVREIGGESIIILRDRGGRLRAFYNVCRHRGTRICEESSGRFSETIQCPYHAWTYSLDGQLIGAPFMNEVRGFDKHDHPLHPVAVDSWDGFLFVNLDRESKPFAEAFAPLVGRFSRFNMASLRPARRIGYDLRANWKLIFQNYSECLHCPTLHPGLARLSPYQSGENDLHEGPYLGGYMDIAGNGGSLTMSGRACGQVVGDGLPPEDHNRVYYYSIFPNMLLSLHPDYVMFHMLWPQAPGRTRVECEWLFHAASFAQPGFDPNDAIEFWDITNRQDWHICELSQLGVSSRAYSPGPYSSRESIPAAWDREYLRTLQQS